MQGEEFERLIGLGLSSTGNQPVAEMVEITGYLVIINVVLGIFNFIPIPPLDGSKILSALLDAPKRGP